MMTPDDPRHGTPTGYTTGRCRKQCCRDAVARAWNIYEMRRAANGGRPLTVPKIGAVRRLQALMALGWPRREIARRAGWQGDALGALIYGKRQTILLDTHRRIADLYEVLSGTPGPSQRSRDLAAERGWATPLAWEDIDIDDPTASPDPGLTTAADDVDEVAIIRALDGDASVHLTRPERFEVVRRARAAGWTLRDIEDRTSITKPERYHSTAEEGSAA